MPVFLVKALIRRFYNSESSEENDKVIQSKIVKIVKYPSSSTIIQSTSIQRTGNYYWPLFVTSKLTLFKLFTYPLNEYLFEYIN